MRLRKKTASERVSEIAAKLDKELPFMSAPGTKGRFELLFNDGTRTIVVGQVDGVVPVKGETVNINFKVTLT